MAIGTLTEPIKTTNDLAKILWSHGASGVQISGDAGSGKSIFAQNCFRSIARQGDAAMLLIDPAGDLAKACLKDCLDMGPSVRRRTQYIKYGDTSTIVPLNPLHVERTAGMDDFTYAARLSCRVSHCAHLLLTAWGQESWEGTPLLYKWVTLFLKSLAEMGLPIAEVKHFLQPQSEVFQLLAACVPDYYSRMELQKLTQLRPKEVTEQLQSTANRWRGFFDNPVTEATLGVSDPRLCADVGGMLDERRIVIIDVAPEGVLRDEDVQIIANLWLAEWLHQVLSRPQEQRVPSAIFCDELPVFFPSFKLVERSLRVQRKALAKFFGIHQGTQAFPDTTDNPLLHNMVGQTGIKAYFRHIDPADADFFGRILALPKLDPLLEKFRHSELEQYQDGWEVRTLVDRAFTSSYADMQGGASSSGADEAENWTWAVNQSNTATLTNQEGTTDTHSDSQTQNESKHEGVIADQSAIEAAYRNSTGTASGSGRGSSDSMSRNQSSSTANAAQQGASEGGGGSRSRSHQESGNWQRTVSHSQNTSYRRQLVPVLRWREVLRMIEFFSFDEQERMTAGRVARQQTGQCFLYVAGIGVAQVDVPFPRDPFAGAPKAMAEILGDYFCELHELPHYHTTENLIAHRAQVLQNFVQELQGLADRRLLLGNAGREQIDRKPSDLIDEVDGQAPYRPKDYDGGF